MASPSWHILSLLGALGVALEADAGTPESASTRSYVNNSVPSVVAPVVSRQSHPGFVVLHFGPSASGNSARACRQGAKTGGRATLFREYRTAGGEILTINGQVALRFKASTSDAQIDSLIAATGVEVFSPVKRSGCRRYVLKVVHLEDNLIAVANALQASGLVEYAVPDSAPGRSEGIPVDSFYVDQLALTKSITPNDVAVDTAPSKYGMGQMLSEYTGPLMRVGAAEMSARMSAVNSSMSALDLVKSHGITTLHVEIPRQSAVATVRVMLYALNGTPVRQLVSEALEPGRYMVGWDGNDDRGRRLQPGVYVAVMTAGNFHETHRLVVR